MKRAGTTIRLSWGNRLFDTANYVFLGLFAFLTLYPFWYVLIQSFNEGADSAMGALWFWPRQFTLVNYIHLLNNPNIHTAYIVTVSRTVIGSALGTSITYLAAFTCSKRQLPLRNAFITFFMIPMFIGGTVVSNYVVFAHLRLLNTFLVYILPGAFNFFYMIIMRTFLYGIPDSLEESALMDGAGYLRIVVRVLVPLSTPVIATIILFNGVNHWLDFYTNLVYVADPRLRTLQYLLYLVIRANRPAIVTEAALAAGDFFRLRETRVTAESLKMATLIVVTVPMLLIYPFLQKYFVKGVMIGALKE